MKQAVINNSTPFKIGIYYLAWLVSAALICVWLIGADTLVDYAIRSKPYAVLFREYSLAGLTDAGNETTIIYFGDSNSFYPMDLYADSGNPGRHMPALIGDALNENAPQPEVRVAEWTFMGASMFDCFCMFYRAIEFEPDLIIIPINWRSFEWDWFQSDLSAFVPLRERFAADYESPLKERGVTLVSQFDSKVKLLCPYPWGIKAWTLDTLSLRSAYVSITGIPDELTDGADSELKISGSNPTYLSLRALAHVASKYDTRVLFYIWPIEDESRIKDKSAFELSKETIADAARGKNVYFLDLSHILGHADFFDKGGHCTVEGRRKIAGALAERISVILPERTAGAGVPN